MSFNFVFAGTSQQDFLEQFRSHRITFPASESPLLADSPGRYPAALRFLFGSILGWAPTGKGKDLSEACDARTWGLRLQDPRLVTSPQLQGALVQKYFQDCRQEVESEDKGYFTNLRKMMTMKYEPQEHPFLRRVVIQLPGNIKLKGLLALKGDLKPRPLVIARLGIFSSVEEFIPERAWLMMLFEQSPFNVLLLENMSSSDFVANNSRFAFGGYDEGIQNIQVAKLLTSPDEPLSRIVDSVHLFGVSLGGHGVLFASLLNKYNSDSQKPLINSFMAMCPVVHLKPTMDAMVGGGVKSAFVDMWSRQRLQGLDGKLPGLVGYESFSFLSKAISEIARTYQGGLSYVSNVHLPPGMKDGPNFWELNDFWKYYKQVKQPVMIYANLQDPAVPYEINSRQILNRQMKIESKNIRVVELEQGVHCTLPVSYDWHTMSSLLQSYVLSHSPGFKMMDRSLDVDLSDDEWQGFIDSKTKLTFEVQEPDRKSGFAALEIELTNGSGDQKSMSLSLPLSDFDFRFLNSELSTPEQEMIVRWLNQNLHVRLLRDQNRNALKISWAVAR